MRTHPEIGARIVASAPVARPHRRSDPLPSRALRRHRLPGRAEGRGDPGRRRDDRRLRSLRGDDAPPPLQRRDHRRGGAGRAAPVRGHAVPPRRRRGFLAHVPRLRRDGDERRRGRRQLQRHAAAPHAAPIRPAGSCQLPSARDRAPAESHPVVRRRARRRSGAAPLPPRSPAPTPMRSASGIDPGASSSESSSLTRVVGAGETGRRRGSACPPAEIVVGTGPVADQRARQQQARTSRAGRAAARLRQGAGSGGTAASSRRSWSGGRAGSAPTVPAAIAWPT